MNIFFKFLFIIYAFKFINSLCRMKQDCNVMDPNCKPSPADYTNATILKGTMGSDVFCPEYLDQYACCSNGQNQLLKKNFDSLDQVFGTKYGGCDICSVNLKRFWCKFTCDPEQHTFMNATGYGHFVIKDVNYTLLMVEMNLNNQMNCDLFNSCKKTKYASQVSAMSNAIGFTTFQGTEAYMKSPIFISMSYTKEGGLNFENDQCDTKADKDGKVRGFHIDAECKCNSCDKSCHYEPQRPYPVLEGFSFLIVGLVYFIVLLCTAIIYVCKCYYRRKNPEASSRSSSIDSEFGMHSTSNEFANNSQSLMNGTKNNINNILDNTGKHI